MLSSGALLQKLWFAKASVCHIKKMPKSKKQPVLSKQKDEKSDKKAQDVAVYENAKKEIVIKVHAKPGAKESAVTDVSDGAVGVQIGAAAVDGEANKELVRYLAGVLQLKKSEISLDKGSRSREKTVLVSSASSAAQVVLDKLTAASKLK